MTFLRVARWCPWPVQTMISRSRYNWASIFRRCCCFFLGKLISVELVDLRAPSSWEPRCMPSDYSVGERAMSRAWGYTMPTSIFQNLQLISLTCACAPGPPFFCMQHWKSLGTRLGSKHATHSIKRTPPKSYRSVKCSEMPGLTLSLRIQKGWRLPIQSKTSIGLQQSEGHDGATNNAHGKLYSRRN